MRSLSALKNVCPAEISYGHIHVVLAYLELRDHLNSFNIPYDDFDPLEELDTSTEMNIDKADSSFESKTSQSQSLSMFLKIANEELMLMDTENKDFNNESLSTNDDTPPLKKPKHATETYCEDLLDDDIFDNAELDSFEVCKITDKSFKYSPIKSTTGSESEICKTEQYLQNTEKIVESQETVEKTVNNSEFASTQLQKIVGNKSKVSKKLPPWMKAS